MSFKDQFTGGESPPTTLATNWNAIATHGAVFPGVITACGALTADTYPGTPQINISGKGAANFVMAYTTNTTSRTVTVKVVIDGTQVLEDATTALTAANHGICVVGFGDNSGPTFAFDQIPFNSSFQVYVKTSDTQTDEVNLKHVLRYR